MEENLDYPTNETPSFLANPLQAVLELLSHYGWGVLFVAVSLTILCAEIFPRWRKWREKKENQRAEEELLSSPEKILAREEAMIYARRKLQEKYDILAAQHAEKIKEKEEMKRKEKLEELDKLQKSHGVHSKYRYEEEPSTSSVIGSSKGHKSSDRLRGDYNPLMGSGGNASYRPSRRCTSGGGG